MVGVEGAEWVEETGKWPCGVGRKGDRRNSLQCTKYLKWVHRKCNQVMKESVKNLTDVAVIGAGVAGLTAIKACKEEGLNVICYEKFSKIGGLWRCTKETEECTAGILRSTITNSSKEMSAFSDFPPPDDFPNYMTQGNVIKYLQLYAENFNLLKHIYFQHEVIQVKPVPEFAVTGKWEVIIRGPDGELKEQIFGAVFVCTGQQAHPRFPDIPDIGCFCGEVKHSAQYRYPEEMVGKTVLVIGAGNSAADTAVEIAPLAKKVYLSCRRGTWLLPRTGFRGLPVDLMISRFLLGLSNLPFALDSFIMETLVNWLIDHRLYGLRPQGRIWDLLPTVNDFLLTQILSGNVTLKGSIQNFTQNGVIFEGEQEPTTIDAVICATGYQPHFNFLDQAAFPDQNPSSFYKRIFPTYIMHPTFAIIGFLSTIGSLWPVMELQSRWAVAVALRKLNLPSTEKMLKEIQKAKCREQQLGLLQGRREVPLMSVRYSDELARDIGAKPCLLQVTLMDPALGWTCVAGPWLPYQYRLAGPNSWHGARKAIMEYKHRVLTPINEKHSTKH